MSKPIDPKLLIGELREINIINEYIPGGVLIAKADPDFTIVEANQGYFNLVGYTKEEIYDIYKNKGFLTLHPDEALASAISFQEQVDTNPDHSFSIKTRLVNKQDGYRWVHFSGRLVPEDGLIYFQLVDITDHLRTLAQLEKEQSFNDLIGSLSEDAFFDFDIISRTMRFSKNFAKRMCIQEIIADYPESLAHSNVVAKDSVSLFNINFFMEMDDISEGEIHFVLPEEGDIWYQYLCNIVKDSSGKPVRAVGKLNDITQHKAEIYELSVMAQRDQLTGLYNKFTTEYLIKETLKQRRFTDDEYILMIIDIDNFKSVNDKLGHLYGDIVLTQLSDFLKPLFRADDIAGRVGGDEFFVLMKNCKQLDVVEAKAHEICRLFRKTYVENDTKVSISASIGIARCPEHGIEFEDLYKNADVALYNTKATGKNGFTFYDGITENEYKSTRTEIDAHGGIQKSFRENRVEYIFKLLYSSEHPNSAIKLTLQLIAEHFGFSRVNVVDIINSGTRLSCTFEWCGESVEPLIGSLQNLPLENFKFIFDSFKEFNGMFAKSILDFPADAQQMYKDMGTKSMVYFPIKDKEKVIGSITFVDMENDYIALSDVELDELRTICQILTTFMQKQRTFEAADANYKSLSAVIQNMEGYAYVIDTDTYEVLFENNKVKTLTNTDAIGKRCHQAYTGSDSPCEVCPLLGISEQNPKNTVEIYNEKYNAYSRTTGSIIDWVNGKKVCLINSIDVTEYKM